MKVSEEIKKHVVKRCLKNLRSHIGHTAYCQRFILVPGLGTFVIGTVKEGRKGYKRDKKYKNRSAKKIRQKKKSENIKSLL